MESISPDQQFFNSFRLSLTIQEILIFVWIIFQIGFYTGKKTILKKYRQFQKMKQNWQFQLPYQSNQILDEERKSKKFKSSRKNFKKEKSQLQNQKQKPNQIYNEKKIQDQFLSEKINLEMKKEQSLSFFEIRMETSKNNKYVRKIQKHQIVTDYQLESETDQQRQLVQYKGNILEGLNTDTLFEVMTYKNHKNLNLSSPLLQKRLINLSQLNQKNMVSYSYLENGRFDKLFNKNKLIGQGGYGKVFEAVNIFQNKSYAIKKIFVKGLMNVNEVLNEANIISHHNHQNVVRFYSCWFELANINQTMDIRDFFYSSSQKNTKEKKDNKDIEVDYFSQNSDIQFQNSISKSVVKQQSRKLKSIESQQKKQQVQILQIYTLYIQMQLCQGGNLANYLRKRQKIDAKQSFYFFCQLLKGIEFLHQCDIVHRDLKPGNILLDKKQEKIVKIGDFGLSVLINNLDKNFFENKVGTPCYIAPQLENSSREVKKESIFLVDIYSVGVIYYEMLSEFNKCTHHERNEKMKKLKHNIVDLSSEELKEQKKMIKILTKNSANRPTIREIYQKKQFKILISKYREQPKLE